MSPDNEAEAFLGAIFDDPDNDDLRLVYADWLEERGDVRGEFIRVECTLARLPRSDRRWRSLWYRDLELITAYKEVWFGPVRRLFSSWECHRGFLDELSASAAVFLEHADALCRAHPVEHVRLGSVAGAVDALAACPYLGRLATLSLGHNYLADADMRELASANLARLRTLNLAGNVVSDSGVRALAECPTLTRLESLHLDYNRIRPEGAQALAGSANLARLTTLGLNDNRIEAAGVRALLHSPHLTRLTRLELAGSWGRGADPSDGARTAATPNVGNDGVVLLAESPAASQLTVLDLSLNDIQPSGFQTLADSPYLAGLTTLRLAGNQPTDAERQALLARFGSGVHF